MSACISERIEPAVTHIIGALGTTVLDAVKEARERPSDVPAWCRVRNSVSKLTYALDALNRLAACTDGATHFHVAISNETRRIEKWIADINQEFGLGERP